MKVRAIIQARMGSSRMRGKTLSSISGQVLLKQVYKTVLNLHITDDIVIATTNLEEDDPIESYCINYLNSKIIRGSSNNVLSRFVDACFELDDEDTIIRITADNIFYQKEICNNLIEIHLKENLDYTGIKGLSHISCELIKVSALRKTLNEQLSDYDKEHVTPFFINNPGKFEIRLIDPTDFDLNNRLDALLTIDSKKDRVRVEKMMKEFEKNRINYTQKNLYNWLINNIKINK